MLSREYVRTLKGYQQELTKKVPEVRETEFMDAYLVRIRKVEEELNSYLWEHDIQPGIVNTITQSISQFPPELRAYEEKKYLNSMSLFPYTAMGQVLVHMLNVPEKVHTEMYTQYYNEVLLKNTLLVSPPSSGERLHHVGEYIKRASAGEPYKKLVSGILGAVQQSYGGRAKMYQQMDSYITRHKLGLTSEDILTIWERLTQAGITEGSSGINVTIKSYCRTLRKSGEGEQLAPRSGSTKFTHTTDINEQVTKEYAKYGKEYEKRMKRMYYALEKYQMERDRTRRKANIQIVKHVQSQIPTLLFRVVHNGATNQYILTPYSVYNIGEQSFVLKHQATIPLTVMDEVLKRELGPTGTYWELQEVIMYRKLNVPLP